MERKPLPQSIDCAAIMGHRRLRGPASRRALSPSTASTLQTEGFVLLQVDCELRHCCGGDAGNASCPFEAIGARIRLTLLANLMGKACDGAVVKVMGEGGGALAFKPLHLGALASNIAVVFDPPPPAPPSASPRAPNRGRLPHPPTALRGAEALGAKKLSLSKATPHQAPAPGPGAPGHHGGALEPFDGLVHGATLRLKGGPLVIDEAQGSTLRVRRRSALSWRSQAVFRAAGEHAIRLLGTQANQVINQHPKVSLVPFRKEGREPLHPQRRVRSRQKAPWATSS